MLPTNSNELKIRRFLTNVQNAGFNRDGLSTTTLIHICSRLSVPVCLFPRSLDLSTIIPNKLYQVSLPA